MLLVHALSDNALTAQKYVDIVFTYIYVYAHAHAPACAPTCRGGIQHSDTQMYRVTEGCQLSG